MIRDSQGSSNSSGDDDGSRRQFSPMSPFIKSCGGYGAKTPTIPRNTFKDRKSRPLIAVQEVVHSPDRHHSSSLANQESGGIKDSSRPDTVNHGGLVPSLKTYVDMRNLLHINTDKHSLFSKAALSQSNQPEDQEVTFLLFRSQIN